jgi:hypothetical protein
MSCFTVREIGPVKTKKKAVSQYNLYIKSQCRGKVLLVLVP